MPTLLPQYRFKPVLFLALAVALTAVLLAPAPTYSQDEPEVLASGLNNPRGIFFAPDGTLFVTEGGAGGDVPIETPEGPATFGSTSQVVVVAPDGTVTPMITNLPSAGGSGANAIYGTADAMWLVITMGPPNTLLTATLYELDPSSTRVRRSFDLFSLELATNPDGNEIDSNPVDVTVADDGTVFVVDAGANTLYRVAGDALEVVATWPDNPVPTSVDVDAEGNIYVGFLSPAPFLPGSARVEKWSADGMLVETFEGLNMVVDVLVGDDGSLYAVEFAGGLGDQGFIPESGRVVEVGMDGTSVLLDGLVFPYGLAQAPDGRLAVSVGSSFLPPGSGSVIAIPSN